MKKLFLLLISLFLILTLSACNDEDNPQAEPTNTTADKFYGTWDSHSAQIDGSLFTIEELETIGDYSLSDFRIIIKEGGKAYVYAEGEGELLDWELTDTGIKIGIRDCILQDDLLLIANNDITIFLSKISSGQIISNPETPNNAHTHSGGTATCSKKAVCSTCGKNYGSYNTSNHESTKFVYSSDESKHCKKYSCCGYVVTTSEHIGGMATCKEKAICSTCGHHYGSYDAENHASSQFIYEASSSDETKHDMKYFCCGFVVSTSEHIGGFSTTTEKAICKYCNVEYESSNTLEYTLSSDGSYYIVTSIGTCTNKDVIIPKEYNGKSVTSIGNYAFYDCSSLTSISIPDSITTIGNAAFYGCSSLTTIAIPDGVTSIENETFSNCYSLTDVTMGSGIVSIGDQAFKCCSNITTIIIGNSVTSIGNQAFSYCANLANITIGNGVISIGCWAFQGCNSLTNIFIPDSVEVIVASAFEDCSNLTSVTMGDSITSIGFAAFRGCDRLADIYYSGTETDWTKISIGDWNFELQNATIHYNCICDEYGQMLEYTLSYDGTYFAVSGIGTCTNTKIIIPDSCKGLPVIGLARYAFSNCDHLTSIIIPNSVNFIGIGEGALYNCSSLTDIYYAGIEDEWKSVSVGYGNSSLKNATIHYNYVPEQ